MARKDCGRVGFCVGAFMAGKHLKTPKLSPVADNAITWGGIRGLGSLMYICDAYTGPTVRYHKGKINFPNIFQLLGTHTWTLVKVCSYYTAIALRCYTAHTFDVTALQCRMKVKFIIT